MSAERDDRLRRLLRAGDPAGGDPGLGPAERAAMRRRMVIAGRERRQRPAGWLVPATAALALLALALGLALRQPRPLPTPSTESTPAAWVTASADQQIQFTTENGTLVVWVLQGPSTG